MSSFTSALEVEVLPDGRKFKLTRPFTYHIGTKFSRKYISVPKGFITDFASTPNFLWWWLPPFGKYTKAAVIHDYIYQTKSRTRKEADQIFKEAMIVGGTRKWKAKLMYWGVRIGGWLAWKGKSNA